MGRKEVVGKVSKETIHFMSFHDINMVTKEVTDIDVSEAEDLKEYIIGKLKYIIDDSKNCREFKLSETDKGTYNKIIESLRNINEMEKLNNQAEVLANKLITKQNNSMSDGGLVQAIFIHNDIYYYVFIKNEFEDVIQRSDMKKVDAFIYGDKAPLKTALFEIKEKERAFEINQIFVDDSQTSPFAQFWYNDFLNLIPVLDNEINTTNFLEAVQGYWHTVEDDHLIDSDNEDNETELGSIRFKLSNNSKGFLTNNKTFRLHEYLETLTESFSGIKLNRLDKIKEDFEEMSNDEHFGFSKTFDIEKSILNRKKYKYAYKPQKNIDLSIAGKIDNNLIYLIKKEEEYILNIIVDKESDKEIVKRLRVIEE